MLGAKSKWSGSDFYQRTMCSLHASAQVTQEDNSDKINAHPDLDNTNREIISVSYMDKYQHKLIKSDL